jgi:hypothetical protein
MNYEWALASNYKLIIKGVGWANFAHHSLSLRVWR